MQTQRFGNLLAHSEYGIQRGHGILKDHRDVVAAYVTHLAVGKLQQIPAFKKNLSGGDLPWRRHEPHD